MSTPKRWTVTVQAAADGSGDVILQLPDDLWVEMEAQSWQVGDLLEIDVCEPGRASIQNYYADCRRPAARDE